jgi:hypothetical protein
MAKKKAITSLEQIPQFDDLVEMGEFWETHELAPELYESGPLVDADFYKRLGITRLKNRKPKRLSKTG